MSYDEMSADDLRREYLRTGSERPEPKATVRAIQSAAERAVIRELQSGDPDETTVGSLMSVIKGIDNRYLQDPSKYGTIDWRIAHPLPHELESDRWPK